MWDRWVIDVTLDELTDDPELFRTRCYCFCPYEQRTGDVVVGMNLVTDWPETGNVVGIVHADGQEAVEKWIADHKEDYEKILARIDKQGNDTASGPPNKE